MKIKITHLSVFLTILFASNQIAFAIDRDLYDISTRQSIREIRSQITAERVRVATKESVTSFTFGGTYTQDEDEVKIFNTPFVLGYKIPDGDKYWKFAFSGNGLTHVSIPGEKDESGISNLKLSVTRPITPSITGQLSTTIPTGAPVGSKSSSQAIRLTSIQNFENGWGLVGIIALTRLNKINQGEDRIGKTAYAHVSYNLTKSMTLISSVSRSHRGGAGGSTDVALELDFPFLSGDVAISLGKGVSKGNKLSSITIDFSKSF
jgi:hypothetical protein